MFRKLSLVLAVTAALSPVGVYALGLGEIVTRSALNETFKAEIPLVSVEPGEIDVIKATLASSVDFARAGLDRPFLLSKLRFKAKQLEDGRAVILISTGEPVREPFLNFLIEVNWPKGRLIREFTVLLDPPVTLDSAPPPIERAVAPSAAEVRPVRRRTSGATPVAASEPARPAVYPVTPVATPQPARPTVAAPRAADTAVDQYGPVRAGETLWGIARGLGVQGASTKQVAIALFRENPEAFGKNNINFLLKGAVLRVPGRDEVLNVSRAQAREEFRKSVDEAPVPRTVAATTESAKLRIATVPSEDEETPETDESPAAGGRDIEQVKTDLMMVRETSESTRQETEELHTRVRELEEQLSDIRTLLKLKSDELALLQSGQMDEMQTPDSQPMVSEEVAEMYPPLAEDVEPEPAISTLDAEAEMVVGETPETGEPAEMPMEALQPSPEIDEQPKEPPLDESSKELAAVAERYEIDAARPISDLEPEMARKPVEEEPAKPVTPTKTTAPSSIDTRAKPPSAQPNFFDRFMSDSTMMGVGGGSLVILMALAWLLIRRRRETEDQFPESVLVGAETGDQAPAEFAEESDMLHKSAEGGEETSFISDFSPSDIDALQEETGEVDPAAEADVYIAYGRYQQAENLINQAIEKSPERVDLKVKLLEIYFTTRNVPAFTALAERMNSEGAAEQDPQSWARANSMGRELIPNSPLFGGEGPGRESIGGAASGADDSALSGNSDFSEGLADFDLDLDSNLSEVSNEPMAESRGAASKKEIPGVAGSGGDAAAVSGFGKDTDKGKGPEPTGLVSGAASDTLDDESGFSINLEDLDSLEDIDLGDLGLEDEEQTETLTPASETLDPDDQIEHIAFNQPQMDVSGTLDVEEEELEPFSLDDLELSPEESAKSGNDGALEPEFAAEGEQAADIETKLDLARAYVEMGDGDGARDILEEVLEEGNDKQKSSAKEILGQIA